MTVTSRIPIHVRVLGEPVALRASEPVTIGVPFPPALSTELDDWALVSGGDMLDVQARVLERWPDGSVRWALLDFQASLPPSAQGGLLTFGKARGKASTRAPIRIEPDGARMRIDTGKCSIALDAHAAGLFADVKVNGLPVIAHAGAALQLAGSSDEAWEVRWDDPTVECAGPLRSTIVTHGRAGVGNQTRVGLTLRLDFYAGSSTVGLRLTTRNPTRAAHHGGIWELGDPGSRLIKQLAIVLPRPDNSASPSFRYSLERDSAFARCASHVHVYQESSGGANWQSANHVNRDGVVPLRLAGYEARADDRATTGRRATPIVVLEDGERSLAVTMPRFWENFPAAVDADESGVRVSFWPSKYPDLQELQGGEQKTHECYLTFGPATDDELRSCRARLLAHVPPEWYAASQAVPFLVPALQDDHETYKRLVTAAVDSTDTFFDKRERIDEFGWRHFGDIYADHEAALHKGDKPLVSHYNNQYDPIAGFLCQFMRTGDERWWTLANDLARHVIDSDIYHTDDDKSAYNHGLFWHTFHYVDAGKSSHRSYPAGTNGGGPSSEHNYTSGLALHYMMTGDVASREAAVGLAQFVIALDDGGRTVFRWLDRGYTGAATASRTPYYHGPGRGSGNSLNALLDGHRLTGNPAFLHKADQIIRRCTHPAQDIAALSLLDVENRWFYTVFLEAVGRYLEYKALRGDLDRMYAYARGVLLHFARWMAVHERPYLDHPEVLEYPTETWAAQDIRKSEVFDYASRHAVGAERDLFLERAGFFHRYSLATLEAAPTRTLARPVVLLLVHGFMRAYIKRHPEELPSPASDWKTSWPRPESFVPQRVRALRRAAIIAVAVTIATIASLALWL